MASKIPNCNSFLLCPSSYFSYFDCSRSRLRFAKIYNFHKQTTWNGITKMLIFFVVNSGCAKVGCKELKFLTSPPDQPILGRILYLLFKNYNYNSRRHFFLFFLENRQIYLLYYQNRYILRKLWKLTSRVNLQQFLAPKLLKSCTPKLF